MIALNVTIDLQKKVSKEGIDSLSNEERNYSICLF
jgi:hypothetical protein